MNFFRAFLSGTLPSQAGPLQDAERQPTRAKAPTVSQPLGGLMQILSRPILEDTNDPKQLKARRKQTRRIVWICAAVFVAIAALGVFSSSDSSDIGLIAPADNTDYKERAALAAEGEFLTSEMERANREHDWSRVNEIRRENNAFKNHAKDYLLRHRRTPPHEVP